MDKYNSALPKLKESVFSKKWRESDLDRITSIKFIGDLQNDFNLELKKPLLKQDIEKLTTLTYSIINMHKYILNIEDKSFDDNYKRILYAYNKKSQTSNNTFQEFPISSFEMPIDNQFKSFIRIKNEVKKISDIRDNYLYDMIREIDDNNWIQIRLLYHRVAKLVYQIYNYETILRNLFI
jgi:hypothetical protein